MSKPLHFDALSVSSVSDLGSGLTTPDTASIQAFTTPLDEVKHPSLKGAEQTPPLSDMEAGEPVEHNEFYMRDEMVVFQVGKVLYRLPSHALACQSWYFKDLFDACPDFKDTESLPILLHDDDYSNEDFERFLKALLPRDPGKCSLSDLEEWTSVLHLAKKWGFTMICSLACCRLFPLASPIQRVVLARKYDLEGWMVDAVVELCLQSEPLAIMDATVLDVVDIIRISQAREAIRTGKTRQRSSARAIVARVFNLETSFDAPLSNSQNSSEVHPANVANPDSLLSSEGLDLDLDYHARKINIRKKGLVNGYALQITYVPDIDGAAWVKCLDIPEPRHVVKLQDERTDNTTASPSAAIRSGIFDTNEVRSWMELVTETSKEVVFDPPFKGDAPPQIAYGLSALDISAGDNNICARSTITTISCNSLTAKLWSWEKSVCYAAALNWLAVPTERGLQTGHVSKYIPRGGGRLHEVSKPPTELARVRFGRPYNRPPTIVCWLAGFDTDKGQNCRVRAFHQDLDGGGFSLCVATWSDTAFYGAGVCWLAIPADAPGVFVLECSANMSKRSGHVAFPSAFKEAPKVIVGLCKLDFQQGRNIRVKVFVKNVTPHGLFWEAQTWNDTNMYEVKFVVVALDPGCMAGRKESMDLIF